LKKKEIRRLCFLRSCVRTHVDVCFREGKCRFACVESSCSGGEYALQLVNELLSPKDVQRLNKRLQEENIRQGKTTTISHSNIRFFFSLAGIDGLECCPHCPYAVIVDNPNDKVFRCLNPECMKETCR